jgi:uncharacterized membrane protein YidH (DUF202 family)
MPGTPTRGEPSGRDPGASAERTRLAWRRTALSAAGVTLLAVRPAFDPRAGGPARLTAGLVMACWVLTVAVGRRRHTGLTATPPRPGRRSIGMCAVLTVAFAALGGLVVML